MDGATLQDRFSRGMGSAAVRLGMPHDLYRGRGCVEPLAAENRALRLSAAFDGGDPGYRRPHGYERALRGIFDVVCTQVGDYLRGPRGVLFIAMLPPLQRPLCVLTNGVLDVLRPVGPQSPGLNGYGGVQEPRLQAVLSGWSVLLPHTPEPILGSDLLRDEAGRRFVVRTAELSELGWRLMVRQAGV
jgi:hypothetical protein